MLQAYIHYQAPAGDPAPELIQFFGADSLQKRAIALCHATAGNTSSMAVDVGKGRQTEVEHINGFIVDLGRRLGVDTPLNGMLVDMVKFTAASQGFGSRTPRSAVKAASAQTADQRAQYLQRQAAREGAAQDSRVQREEERRALKDQQSRQIVLERRRERRRHAAASSAPRGQADS